MIVKGKYKYHYSTVNLRLSVAKRFRAFSKEIAKSHSEAISIMIDFFEWHGFSPSKRFSKSIAHEILKNRERTETSIKRIEAAIAIIRNIEVNQTKPNNAMLLSLFGECLKQEEPMKVERKFMNISTEEKQIEATVPETQYERLEDKMNSVKKDFSYVLDHVKPVKSTFGKDYFRLELTEEELVRFRRIYKRPFF